MGATIRSREFDVDQPSQTEQLANWINRVRLKKITCRKNRKRNFRVEAVLTSVLCKAEHELRNKQLSRIIRWQQMKQRLLEDMDYKNILDKTNYDADTVNCYGRIFTEEHYNAWTGPLCPELSSFDTFMSQLSEIKAPLQR